ncbi:unnamed protein product [Adineta steineri]|uniref:NAD(P)(+)--arginine ADP-ribosyltransferase n=1 Tax=Adineta steineri TaxID=433720 RepID=A0A815HVE8_9BILA|nr:unnamed protein product [Adineta steineri]
MPRNEPVGKLLIPISGYQNEPLLPLEEALSSVLHFFIDLEQHIWIAKYNCQNPQDGLTQDESSAIHLYTLQFESGDSLYIVLNRLLRAEKRDCLVPWFKFLKLFITALCKLDSIRATVWRGVRGGDLSLQYPTGRQFAWWGVSSCTTTPDVIQTTNFLGKSGTRTLFSIECINGKSIKKHSYFSESEKEIVLLPGTFFEVIGQVNPAEGLHIIHLKEIQPPFQLLKLPLIQQPVATQTKGKHELYILGRKNQYLELIRSNGTHLGFMLNQHDIERNWFELRRPEDMSVLHSADLIYNDYVHRVMALPNTEFLIHTHDGKQLFVLDKNGSLKPPIKSYANKKGIVSTAFIKDVKCFVIQTNEPRELHFYDL